MSYEQTEIPRKRNDWVNMLRQLAEGEEKPCALEDRGRIMVSIANNFPKHSSPYRFTTKKKDEFTFILKREKNAKILDNGKYEI